VSENELQHRISELTQERDNLLIKLSEAYRFRRYAYKIFRENGIAFVAPNACECPFCGTTVENPKQACDLTKCPACGHQMRKSAHIDRETSVSTVKECVCPQCGQIDERTETLSCDSQLCSVCTHQMRNLPSQDAHTGLQGGE
jgi:hypothetical protein